MTFALALLVIGAWSAASVISLLVDLARGHAHLGRSRGSARYVGLGIGLFLLCGICVLAFASGWRRWSRRSRLRTKLIVLALAAGVLGPSIAFPSAWGLGWSAVVVALVLSSLAAERKLPPIPKAVKKPTAQGWIVCDTCGRLGSPDARDWRSAVGALGTVTLCPECGKRTA